MDRSGVDVVNRLLARVRSRRWAVKAAAALASALAMPWSSAAHPVSHQVEEGTGTYGGRDVSFGEEDGALVIRIDGKAVDTVARVQAAPDFEPLPRATFDGGDDVAALASPAAGQVVVGAYRSSIFPFRTFDSLRDISRALIDTEGELWVLDN